MDNRKFSITAEGDNDFSLAMQIAFGKYKKAVGYKVTGNVLLFYWVKSNDMTPLPFEMDISQATEFAKGWLKSVKPSIKQPDHDGDNYVGFSVWCESWGQVGNDYAAFVAIEPIWAMYGK